jgi:flagellar basal-body rod protein FlgF
MDGMHWMASAMRAAQLELETATQNLANVTSDGFRRVRALVALRPDGLNVRNVTDDAQGGLRQTGRALDVALLGPGAFRVAGGATRDGAFVRDRDGFLADGRGRRVGGVDGPIRVSDHPVIAGDGTVRDDGCVVGRIALPAGTRVRAGALESSGVDAIGETLAILTAQRAFETAQKVTLAIDQTREKAVNDVVRFA